jgi:hypothetical protein
MQRRLFNFVAVAMSLTTAAVALAGAGNPRALQELPVDQLFDIGRDAIGEMRWHV